MRSWIVAFGIVTLVSWTEDVHATLIVAYRSSDEVIIAADSLRTVGTTPPFRILACKIRNFRDVVFASSGRSSLPGGVFSLDAITAPLHEDNGPVSEDVRNRIVRFDEQTIAAFKTIQNQSRKVGPITFTYILSFVQKGHPVVYSRTLKSSDGGAEIGRMEMLPEGEVLLAGQHDFRDHRSSVRIPNNATPSELLKAVIDHQAQGLPNKVGGPVDIIRITAKGVEWLQLKPECRIRE